MPIEARKLLIMMMMRSEKPSMLRMCKMVALSYVTFNTVSVIILYVYTCDDSMKIKFCLRYCVHPPHTLCYYGLCNKNFEHN